MGDVSIQFNHLAALVKRLGKPLSIFDLETSAFTGSPNFGITEVAVFTVLPDGRGFLYGDLINPENMIEPEASRVTGITQAMVANQETWGKKYAALFHKLAKDHILGGFNIKTFDCPAVIGQNARYGIETEGFESVIDGRYYYRHASGTSRQSGTLVEIAALMGIKPKMSLHRAKADVILTVELFDALVKAYGEEAFTDELHRKKKNSSKAKFTPEDLAAHLADKEIKTLEALAESLQVQESELEYPLCQAVDRGFVDPRVFAHPETRKWLRMAIPAMVQGESFDGKLKPLYEKLSQTAPSCAKLTYLQLRVGLIDAGYTWGMLKAEAVPA